jgi:hypothetical protein
MILTLKTSVICTSFKVRSLILIKMLKFWTLVAFIMLVNSKPEYYSRLGLHRGAGINDVKKAFKKLAAKFHPDRAPPEQKEEFNRKFSEISDAYTLLSDPEMKNIYDRGGHDALEQHRQHQEHHNQHKARQEYHQSMVTDHFANTDILILNEQSLPRFLRRYQVWIVLFYRSQDAEMTTGLKEMVQDLNTKFYGIFTVSAVNCDQDEKICDQYRASNTPEIHGFPSDFSHDGVRYTGDKVTPKVAGFAVGLMQNFVSVVTAETLPKFLEDDSKIKMLLFTDKKETPPLIKSLSKEFRSSVDIGQVKDSTNSIQKTYGVTKNPQILILKKNEQSDWTPIRYEGSLSMAPLSDFIREHREVSRKSPRKRLYEVQVSNDVENYGCGHDSKQVCAFLFYSDQNEKARIVAQARPVVESMGDAPIVVMMVPRSMVNFDSLGVNPRANGLLLKASRNRIHVLEDVNITADELTSIFDKVVGGTLSFKPNTQEFWDSLRKEEQDL